MISSIKNETMKYPKLLFALCTAVLFLSGTFEASAQERAKGRPQQNREKVQQLKIAYFTKELDLSTEDAEKFWPIYNEMTDKIRAQKKIAKKAAMELKDNASTFSEEQFKTKSEEALEARVKEAQLQKEYHGKIAEVIGYKKASKLLSLEAQFKRELLKRLAEGQELDTSDEDE